MILSSSKAGPFDRSRALQKGNDGESAKLYIRSYLLIRLTVGLVGFLMPTLLLALDGLILEGGLQTRDSLSSYYHTGAGDLFVGGLSVIGVLLITYLAGQKRETEYWLSTLAGLAVLVVAYFPTKRPEELRTLGICERANGYRLGCAPLQARFGEVGIGVVHFAATAIFIACIGLLCIVFGARESSVIWRYICYGCAGGIMVGVVWIFLGPTVDFGFFGFHPLYVGEVVCVYSFAIVWLVKGRDVFKYSKNRTGTFFA